MYKYNLFFVIDRLFIFFEIYILKAFILAIDSFGFETDLRTHTAGPSPFAFRYFVIGKLYLETPWTCPLPSGLLRPNPPQLWLESTLFFYNYEYQKKGHLPILLSRNPN
jgi:hypothetical protein